MCIRDRKAKAQFLLFETSNPRHAHEWEVFKNRKSEIPDNKILVPGVVDTTTNFIEHPELVRQRIERFINIVGEDRVIAGLVPNEEPKSKSPLLLIKSLKAEASS